MAVKIMAPKCCAFNIKSTCAAHENKKLSTKLTQSEAVGQDMSKELERLDKLVVERRNQLINLSVDAMTLQAANVENSRKHQNSTHEKDARIRHSWSERGLYMGWVGDGVNGRYVDEFAGSR